MELFQYQQRPYNLILRELCLALNNTLQDIIGIYLHGSLAMNCHTFNRSDIDIIAVVDTDSNSKRELRFLIEQLMDIESKYDTSIEISVVSKRSIRCFIHPSRFILHYSKSHRDRYLNDPDYFCGPGVDPDLAAHFFMVEKRGVVIYGQEIGSMFKGDYEDAYWDSVLRDISCEIEDTGDNHIYLILNYCRTLMYLITGEVGSKLEGGLWFLDNMKSEFCSLVESAILGYQGQTYGDFDIQEIKDFRENVLALCGFMFEDRA